MRMVIRCGRTHLWFKQLFMVDCSSSMGSIDWITIRWFPSNDFCKTENYSFLTAVVFFGNDCSYLDYLDLPLMRRHDRYDRLGQPSKNILRIHPSFRVIALAEPPAGGPASTGDSSTAKSSTEQNWLNAETLNLFLFHQMRSLNLNEERQIVYSLLSASKRSIPSVEHLLKFVHELRDSPESQLKIIARSLSTRNVLRIARHCQALADNYHGPLRDQLIRQTSAPFLPRLVQDAFYEALNKSGLPASESTATPTIDWKQSAMDTIGSQPTFEHVAKVPFTVFYENPIHSEIIQQMHQSFQLGEHLLLIGPQGYLPTSFVSPGCTWLSF